MELFKKENGFISPLKTTKTANYGLAENEVSIIWRTKDNGKNPSYSICFGSRTDIDRFKYLSIAKKNDTIYLGFHNSLEISHHAKVSLTGKSSKDDSITSTVYSRVVLEFILNFFDKPLDIEHSFRYKIEKMQAISNADIQVYSLSKKRSLFGI
jgi:hypothetical protein